MSLPLVWEYYKSVLASVAASYKGCSAHGGWRIRILYRQDTQRMSKGFFWAYFASHFSQWQSEFLFSCSKGHPLYGTKIAGGNCGCQLSLYIFSTLVRVTSVMLRQMKPFPSCRSWLNARLYKVLCGNAPPRKRTLDSRRQPMANMGHVCQLQRGQGFVFQVK